MFTNIPVNLKDLSPEQRANLTKTFENGGYYTYDIDDKLTVIGLNTIYWCSGNFYFNGNRTTSHQEKEANIAKE